MAQFPHSKPAYMAAIKSYLRVEHRERVASPRLNARAIQKVRANRNCYSPAVEERLSGAISGFSQTIDLAMDMNDTPALSSGVAKKLHVPTIELDEVPYRAIQ